MKLGNWGTGKSGKIGELGELGNWGNWGAGRRRGHVKKGRWRGQRLLIMFHIGNMATILMVVVLIMLSTIYMYTTVFNSHYSTFSMGFAWCAHILWIIPLVKSVWQSYVSLYLALLIISYLLDSWINMEDAVDTLSSKSVIALGLVSLEWCETAVRCAGASAFNDRFYCATN